MGGQFISDLTPWYLQRGSVRNEAAKRAWPRLLQVRNESLPATLPHTWSAEGRQYFGTIANDDATSAGVCEIHCNISANACRRRKNDTVDTLRNPDGSQFLRDRIPRPTQTEPNQSCQLRWKRRGEIKISIRRHREDIRHPGILPDTDLASTAQSTLAGRDFTQRGFLFEARIDRSHAYWHKAAAVQPSPFAADHIVGMKIPECYRPEEIALERSGSRDQLRELLARSTS